MRELFLREPELQLIAEAILGQIRIPERHHETPPERTEVKPAIEHHPSPVAAPVVVAAATPVLAPVPPAVVAAQAPMKPAQAEQLAAKVKRFAEHFMRKWEPQKANVAVEPKPTASTSAPAQKPEPMRVSARSRIAHARTPRITHTSVHASCRSELAFGRAQWHNDAQPVVLRADAGHSFNLPTAWTAAT